MDKKFRPGGKALGDPNYPDWAEWFIDIHVRPRIPVNVIDINEAKNMWLVQCLPVENPNRKFWTSAARYIPIGGGECVMEEL